MDTYPGKHLSFFERRSVSGTRRFEVKANADGFHLGMVVWFASWRKYAFYPSQETVFEETCLRDIAAFCELRTAELKELARW